MSLKVPKGYYYAILNQRKDIFKNNSTLEDNPSIRGKVHRRIEKPLAQRIAQSIDMKND